MWLINDFSPYISAKMIPSAPEYTISTPMDSCKGMTNSIIGNFHVIKFICVFIMFVFFWRFSLQFCTEFSFFSGVDSVKFFDAGELIYATMKLLIKTNCWFCRMATTQAERILPTNNSQSWKKSFILTNILRERGELKLPMHCNWMKLKWV